MVVLLHIELITCRLPPWRCRVHYSSRKPRTEHNPLKNGILMIRLDLVPWLETTAAVGMNQPVRGAPIPPHGEVQTRAGQFRRRVLAHHAFAPRRDCRTPARCRQDPQRGSRAAYRVLRWACRPSGARGDDS